MLVTLAMSLALVQGGSFRTDTTVAVQPGTRLALHAMGGEVVVRTWDRGQVRIRASHSANTSVRIRDNGAVLRLDAEGRMGMPGRTDFDLTVPAWMATDFDGMNFSVEADGVASVKASTLNGDLVARRAGEVNFATMNGDIRVEDARGRLSLSTVSGRIEVQGARGDVSAQAVSGHIGLYRIESARVEASTVSGQVIYSGSVRDDGSYALGTHSGAVTFALPAGANATVHTSTMTGGFDASFPLPSLDQRSRGRTLIRFGSGSAAVDLESFSGDVRLVRPHEVPPLPARRSREPGRSGLERLDGAGVATFGLDIAGEVLRGLDLGRLSELSGLAALSAIGERALPVPPIPPATRREWP
jgi:hypothetical protein